MGLPATTTDRLLAVADIIDLTPERWDQTFWFHRLAECDPVDPDPAPAQVAGQGMSCDSVGCIAGWGVALTPRSCRNAYWKSWDVSGRHALGLAQSLAHPLFRAELAMGPGDVADVLRRLAKLSECERDLAGARSVLTDEQYDLLVSDDDYLA